MGTWTAVASWPACRSTPSPGSPSGWRRPSRPERGSVVPEEAPGAEHRQPEKSRITYHVRAALAAWLQSEATRARRPGPLPRARRRLRRKAVPPYFEPYADEYVGVDIGNPAADIEGSVEALPVEDGSFDLVLCTQVLEHVDHPGQAVREARPRHRSGGRVLGSTHGVQSTTRRRTTTGAGRRRAGADVRAERRLGVGLGHAHRRCRDLPRRHVGGLRRPPLPQGAPRRFRARRCGRSTPSAASSTGRYPRCARRSRARSSSTSTWWPTRNDEPGDGRRGLYRLQPRAGAARARGRRPRPRQLFHREARQPRRPGEEVEVVEGELRSYERVHAAVRGCELVSISELSAPCHGRCRTR